MRSAAGQAGRERQDCPAAPAAFFRWLRMLAHRNVHELGNANPWNLERGGTQGCNGRGQAYPRLKVWAVLPGGVCSAPTERKAAEG